MPELIVAPFSRNGICLHLLPLLLCAMMPTLYAVPAQEKAQKCALRSPYNPNTKAEPRIAAEFVAYWANMAFDYQTRNSLAQQQEAASWVIDSDLEKRLDKSFWTNDFRTRPSQCQLISIGEPTLLDEKTVGVTVDAAFSWDFIKLKNVPVCLHFVVKKQSDGYRIDSIQIDYYKHSQFKGMLIISPRAANMMYKDGSEYPDARNYNDAIEKMKPDIPNKNSFDEVFFSWYKNLTSSECDGSDHQATRYALLR